MKLSKFPQPSLAVLSLALAAPMLAAQTPPALRDPPPDSVLVDDTWLPQHVVNGDGVFTATAWPGGVVPFLFDAGVGPANQARVRAAFAEIEACSQVRFVPWAGGLHAIVIRQNPNSAGVSNSEVGMQALPQLVNYGANHWDDKYVLVHELFHALGFLHEQSRMDRGTYVGINYGSISTTACSGSCAPNFDIVIGAVPTSPYDFLSIMHYGQDAFSTDGQPTIVCTAPYAEFQNQIGNRSYMTSRDAQALAARYGGPSAPVVSSLVPSSAQAGSAGFTLTVGGARFFGGSPTADGVQGTRVKWNGTILATTWVDASTVTAWVPPSLLASPGNASVNVENDPDAGWTSPFATFSVIAPPCGSTNDRVGYALAGLGDVDGDGRDDYAVGAPGWSGGDGRVRCHSGATGGVLWTRTGTGGAQFGFALANAGDVDHDGAADVAVGAPQHQGWRGYVQVCSGASGTPIRIAFGQAGTTGEFGWSVAGAGDLDLDGTPDLVVGSPAWNGAGKAELVSGATGGVFFSLSAGVAQANARYGYAVAGGIDLTGDGRPDAIVGAPWYDGAGGQDSGRAEIWSASFGQRVAIRDGDGSYDYFGRSVALCTSTSSFNLGGHAVVGASDFGSLFGAGGGAGYVRVFGSIGLLGMPTVATISGTAAGQRYGQAVAAVGDLDDDGFTDLAIGAIEDGIGAGPAIGPGFVEIRSIERGKILYRISGSNPGDEFGWTVAAAGDTNRDALLDVLVGEPFGDVPCPSAGAFHLVHPPIAPVAEKVLITEVVTGNPAAVELTNFGAAAVSLAPWQILWKDGAVLTSASLGTSIAPGESIVVKEPGPVFAETPPGTQVLDLLPANGTSMGDVGVALRHRNGNVVDEVHVASAVTGAYAEGSLGGRFAGAAAHPQAGPLFGPMQVERIWGLDSNSGGDWYGNGVRSMGLENRGAGERGSDPRPLRRVLLDEIDDDPDYVELHNRSGLALDLAGWSLLGSAGQNAPHARIAPFGDGFTLAPSGRVVIGDGPVPPPELPAGVSYLHIAAAAGAGNIPFSFGEISCALYDAFGRCVDVVRATRAGTELVHNHPRAPSAPEDFGGAAVRTGAGEGSFGRNIFGTDHDSGLDFRALTSRWMGSANGCAGSFCATPWQPDPRPQLDVRVNATGPGGGLTIIVNAGADHAGDRWSFAFTYGHLLGSGPVLGLGPEAVANWLILGTTPPWSGVLDALGSARLDLPSGTLPAGIATDNLFLLQNPAGSIVLLTKVLAWDS